MSKPLRDLVEHVVIVVKENHTFDNYFGTFPGAAGEKLKHAANPPLDDPDHKHQAWMKRESDDAHRVQYVERDIAPYFSLARQFTLCDHYFSEVAGPSTPNHLMLIAADSPVINNPYNMHGPGAKDTYDLKSLPAALEKAGLTWANFGGYAFQYIRELAGHPANQASDAFARQAAAGDLPAVSWVYAEGKPSRSEHPLQNVTLGAEWTARQIQALVDGGLWDRAVIFITWDDWGGWYDHIMPPEVEKWDPTKAQRPGDTFPEFRGQQFRYGSRVPCLVVSPYAKQGHVSQTQRSHISLLKFCEVLWGLGSLNERLNGADDMSDCFDTSRRPLPPPKLGATL